MNFVALLAGKLLFILGKFLSLGAGGTWPGEIALRVSPHMLRSFTTQLRKGIIIVAGTNGKTTTSLMITQILESQGFDAIHNSSGANLLNGVVSAFIQKSNWLGSVDADHAVLEVDENSLPIVLHEIAQPVLNGVKDLTPRNDIIIVLLNLFRDQLDRYGEVDVIAEKWTKVLGTIRTGYFVLNADDPLIAHLGINIKNVIPTKVEESSSSASRKSDVIDPSTALGMTKSVTYFGINDKKQFLKSKEHATDSTFCQNCGARLKYEGIYFSHLGIWKCTKCDEKRPKPQLTNWKSPLPGLYNVYNTLAAVGVAQILNISTETIDSALSNFKPAFGRQEELEIDGKKIKLFLSKNPAGFNASLRTVLDLKPETLLLVLNDRIPDGRDVSWIWDIDIEMIPMSMEIIVSGDRVYDMALRAKYADKEKMHVEPDLEKAIQIGLTKIETGETLYVLPTYSAMLEVRKIIGGRKIL